MCLKQVHPNFFNVNIIVIIWPLEKKNVGEVGQCAIEVCCVCVCVCVTNSRMG